MELMKIWAVVTAIVTGAVALMTGQTMPVHAENEDLEIDLRLFRAQDLPADPTGCHFALWQSDRDPAADAYAYLFFLPFSEDGEPLPARIKVGGDFIELHEIARSQNATPEKLVGGLPRHYVYRSDDPRYRVLIELLKVDDTGSMAQIDEADVYVVRSEKFPFLAGAKGEYGCPETKTAQQQDTRPKPAGELAGWSGPIGVPFGPATLLNSLAEIPAELREQVLQYASEECDLDFPSAWSGARYVINENYLLWEVPCFTGTYQASSTFGVTENPPQDWAKLLTIPNPPSLEGEQYYGITNAQVDNEKGLIRATELGRGIGDCGIYKVLRLIDGPGDTLEFELLEYREKIDCDGKTTIPEVWPLIYKSY